MEAKNLPIEKQVELQLYKQELGLIEQYIHDTELVLHPTREGIFSAKETPMLIAREEGKLDILYKLAFHYQQRMMYILHPEQNEANKVLEGLRKVGGLWGKNG